MSAAGGAYPIVPPLPEYEKRVSVTGPTQGEDTKTETLSPEQQALRTGQRQVTSDAIAATGQTRKLAEDTARIGQQDAELQGFVAQAEVDMQNSPEARHARDYVEWARNHTREEERKLASRPAPALFADRQGWDSVRLAIGMALAGLGDAVSARAAVMAGHAPSNRNTVGDIIFMDLDRQRAAIDKLKDNVVIARTGLKDAEEARRALRADIDLKAKAMYKQAEMLTRARLAALKLEAPAIDQAKEILELRQKQADSELDYVKSHTTSVTKRWDSAKATTETINRVPGASQDTAGKVPGAQAALAKQVQAEVEKLRGMEPLSESTLRSLQSNELRAGAADDAIAKGTIGGAPDLVLREAGAVPRNRYEGLSDKDRKTAAAMDSMVQSLSHVMTGAGMTLSEATKKANTFGFVPGDNAVTMRDKLDRAHQLAGQFLNQAPTSATTTPAAAEPARAPSIQGSPQKPKPPSAKQVAAAKRALERGSGADDEDKAAAREILKRDRMSRRAN